MDDPWDELFEAHAKALRIKARNMCDDATKAEDLVQRTFERYFKWRLTNQATTVYHERAFLMKTLSRLVIDDAKKEQREQELLSDHGIINDITPPVEESPEPPDVTERVFDEAMAALTLIQRKTLKLSLNGMRNKDIAVELGVSEQTVAKRLFDAKKRLKDLLPKLKGRP